MATPFGTPWRQLLTANRPMAPVTDEILAEVALTRAEYEAIVDRIGREPGPLELGMFGALWSEHCGYKHTKRLLRTLPNKSERLLVASGAENAGVVDIGDGLAVAFKIESHNHPSAVEPVQGAATGVGGIVRDILAMGARPIALLNSLRFGDLQSERTRHLVSGVVEGISNYGNCIGVPNVGGEMEFNESFNDNPLVNVMCVGIIEDGRVMSARAESHGDLLVIVGAKTGRDGIHGASGLASRTFAEQAEMRSAVQVGNPFLEKVLIEACLEAAKLPCVVGMQDCGAAGITSAAVEMAARSEMGLTIDVTKVPQREEGMNAYEIMLSESQERMLLAVKPDDNHELFALFEKWDLSSAVIGEFTDDANVVITDGDRVHCTTPIDVLTDAPEYAFDPPEPPYIGAIRRGDVAALPALRQSRERAALQILRSPNIASKRGIWRRYDHQVQNNTVAGPGGDAAVIRIKGTNKALAMSVDGNSRLVMADPYNGAATAVAEACRNVSCVGATPIAITDGLNFGSPENPVIQYQLQESIAGIRDAAIALDVPVVSGNASLYNETDGTPIFPTPIVGALGLIDDVAKAVGPAFKDEKDNILLLGGETAWDTIDGAGASEAMHRLYGVTAGVVNIDLDLEARVQALCRELINDGLIKSAHDCSTGGFAVSVIESCVFGDIGAVVAPQPKTDFGVHGKLDANNWLWQLFGESQSRIVVSIDKSDLGEVAERADAQDVPWGLVGIVGSAEIHVHGEDIRIPLHMARMALESAFKDSLGVEPDVPPLKDELQWHLSQQFMARNR